jgi:hypothetical protein
VAPPPTGACCLADEVCEILTAEECAAAAGEYQGDNTSCDPNPCVAPPPTGACCLADEVCEILTAEECAAAGAEYQGDNTSCDPNPCEQVHTGACGLGYWKNHLYAWEPTGYAPADSVGGIFSCPPELSSLGDDTLMDALRYPGGNGVEGGARLLLRTAVVAVLNASHPDVNYSLSVAEISAAVDAALASLDRRTMQECRHEIDQHNSQGCPLN